jgi:hypothetical protein
MNDVGVNELAARLLVASWSLSDEELGLVGHRDQNQKALTRIAEQAFEMAERFVIVRRRREQRAEA